jgi:anthranilate phosphoribosyltransferase
MEIKKAQDILKILVKGKDLTIEQSEEMMDLLMTNKIPSELGAGLLTALAYKKECVNEITGCVKSMRKHMQKITIETEDLVDVVGTGGDGSNLFNVSTASAILASSAGAKVAKHFNRASSGKSGGADFLEKAGANLALEPSQVKYSLDEINLGFMFAPIFHPAMKNIIIIRKALGIRTIFNIIGPLCNPAGAKKILLGVFDKEVQKKIAQALCILGCEHAWIICSDNTDELMVDEDNFIIEIRNNKITDEFHLDTSTFGLEEYPISALKVSSAKESSTIINDIFAHKIDFPKASPGTNTIVLNAGAVLYLSGVCADIKSGIEMAKLALQDKKPKNLLEKYIKYSNNFS